MIIQAVERLCRYQIERKRWKLDGHSEQRTRLSSLARDTFGLGVISA